MNNEYEKKNIPEVKFSFETNGKSEEEIQKQIQELIKKRNRALIEAGYIIKEDGTVEKGEKLRQR